MKLMVDISEEDYRECKFRKDLLSLGGEPTDLTFNMRMETLIANGTPPEEELEKIKAEIKFKCRLTCTLEEALQIIDNHISELKGE